MADVFVFEQAMKRLEEIVRTLEKGDAPLDASLTLFEEGTSLVKKCGSALDVAEQKLKLMLKTAEGPLEEPFDEQE